MCLRTKLLILAFSGAVLTRVHGGEIAKIVALEVVTEKAATGDGGNAWGGHQCRIVRTSAGVFTAYTVPGEGYTKRQWRLAQRRGGDWQVIAEGNSGREPVNLLAAPDGTLYVVGWPGGHCKIWSGKPNGKKLEMQSQPIVGLNFGHWPYGSAGIDSNGNLCILSSEGSKPGALRWAYFQANSASRKTYTTTTDYRHCYTYVIPDNGALSFVSTRDVRWEVLGERKPQGASDYAFNAFGYWRTDRAGETPLKQSAVLQEKSTTNYPHSFCSAQNDAYIDTSKKLHVLYRRNGESTRGVEQRRHAVFSPSGKLLSDTRIPQEAGTFCRIFQDEERYLYLLGSAGFIYSAGRDGVKFTKPTKIDLQGFQVEYSGFGLAVQRTGSPLGNYIDFVFPAGGGAKWIYGRLLLTGKDELK